MWDGRTIFTGVGGLQVRHQISQSMCFEEEKYHIVNAQSWEYLLYVDRSTIVNYLQYMYCKRVAASRTAPKSLAISPGL